MPFRDPEQHLQDVLEAIEKINLFVGDMNLKAYEADEKTKAAVERKVQILTDECLENIRKSIRRDTVSWVISGQ